MRRRRCVHGVFRDGERFVTDDRFRFLSMPAGAPRMGVFYSGSSKNLLPRKRFVTDDRFRFLSMPAGTPRMGVFDAESSMNSSPGKPSFTVHSANYLR